MGTAELKNTCQTEYWEKTSPDYPKSEKNFTLYREDWLYFTFKTNLNMCRNVCEIKR